jgi:hypothetical protein
MIACHEPSILGLLTREGPEAPKSSQRKPRPMLPTTLEVATVLGDRRCGVGWACLAWLSSSGGDTTSYDA